MNTDLRKNYTEAEAAEQTNTNRERLQSEIELMQTALKFLTSGETVYYCKFEMCDAPFLFSPLINTIATNVHFWHDCPCHDDSVLNVSCYTVLSGLRIFGFPFSVPVGKRFVGGSGDVPDDNWKGTLRSYNYSEMCVEQIDEYFSLNVPLPFRA